LPSARHLGGGAFTARLKSGSPHCGEPENPATRGSAATGALPSEAGHLIELCAAATEPLHAVARELDSIASTSVSRDNSHEGPEHAYSEVKGESAGSVASASRKRSGTDRVGDEVSARKRKEIKAVMSRHGSERHRGVRPMMA